MLNVIAEVGGEALGQVEEGVTVGLVPAGQHGGENSATLGLQKGDDPLPTLGGCHQSSPSIVQVRNASNPVTSLDGTEVAADRGRIETQVAGQICDPDRAL